ncbi:ComEA family DNA-binding protein [Sphingobacterium yanglingense]|uniref:DNA uptake protein ComE-like DNA-binding protein n=1 Tax=Sphingobacterium yanglingense TaxID=1437280 RepID=A0A4R6WSK1_9SPHI|nr:helix-hairpin-helix domain-containing protein [Sphingobacterium yanglingense]TDQ79696.1 DNA uptake protein ComE-like DNA-binding protein [Sphingobacterium yanglingense]
MKKFFKYFELSLAEQRGFIMLSVLILCQLAVPYLYDMVRKEESLDYELTFLEQEDIQTHEGAEERKINRNSNKKLLPLTMFDPNGLSIEQWGRLGLSHKQAQAIKNYEAKGGKFLNKEDLSKMYTISKAQYERLAPYVKIDKSKLIDKGEGMFAQEAKTAEGQKAIERKSTPLIDITTADSVDWVTLRGIGPVFAKRIVNYRNALGGFCDVNQIAEVYGLPPETYESIRQQLYLGAATAIRKIAINRCTIDELSKHPYISRKHAQWIVNYRAQHGGYKNLESLTGIELLDQDFLRKIEPYLEF